MENVIITMKLLEDIHNGKEDNILCKEALEELKAIRPHLQATGQQTVDEIMNGFIGCINKNQFKSAQKKASRLQAELSGSIKGLKQQPNVREQQYPQPSHNATRDPPAAPRHDTNRYTNDNREYDQTKRSKDVARQLRANNPDITDLSDINRPTKIAERFSELYDNEWTEAFEVLTVKKQQDERRVVDFLLEVVTESYRFCNDKVAQMLGKMMVENLKVISGHGQYTMDQGRNDGSDLLREFLKLQAGKAIRSLQTEFWATDVIARNKLGVQLADKGIVMRYVNMCVAICWWMAVQEPPVYMVPTDADHYDPALYRGYTKAGSKPHYFVWPALRLYEKGGILSKGVVQYQ